MKKDKSKGDNKSGSRYGKKLSTYGKSQVEIVEM